MKNIKLNKEYICYIKEQKIFSISNPDAQPDGFWCYDLIMEDCIVKIKFIEQNDVVFAVYNSVNSYTYPLTFKDCLTNKYLNYMGFYLLRN